MKLTFTRSIMWILILLINDIFCVTRGETVAGLILARGGSKGVRLKNLQRVGGVTLVRNAVTIAQGAGLWDITVSTDHPLIALEALRSNASVFHRSFITAADWAPSIWGVTEFLAYRPEIETLVLLQATSPFLKPSQVRDAIIKINKPIVYDCVFSVIRSYQLRWSSKNSQLQPLNFNVAKRPRRQDWDGEMLETGSFYIARKHLLLESKFQNNNMSEPTENITFEELEATDVINVDLVPERKGLILKHCEYYVSSRRHGTTVTRRYNDFVQLYDVLSAKYPYRAVCQLPPKHVVVGGGSTAFLVRRRAALQRWLSLAARHPLLAHDADVRAFLCEPHAKLQRPKHDEFQLAGTHADDQITDESIEEMEAAFLSDQEQLRLLQLGLARLQHIFERAEARCEAEAADVGELGAALAALAAPAPRDSPRWVAVKQGLASAAKVAASAGGGGREAGAGGADEALSLALEALGAGRELGARLRRGLHAERAAAARGAAPHAAALRRRHRYALRAAAHESRVCRAYALRGCARAAAALAAAGAAAARAAALWARLHAAAAAAAADPPAPPSV